MYVVKPKKSTSSLKRRRGWHRQKSVCNLANNSTVEPTAPGGQNKIGTQRTIAGWDDFKEVRLVHDNMKEAEVPIVEYNRKLFVTEKTIVLCDYRLTSALLLCDVVRAHV